VSRVFVAVCAAAFALAAPPAADAIVGGRPATRDYPGMVAMQLRGEFQCGANLLRADWILTAAHCVQEVPPADLTFVLGKRALSDPGGETIGANQVIVHEEYEGSGYDVALVHLARASIQPLATLVSPAQRPLWAPDRRATVIGWGSTVFLGPGSDELREVDVPIVSDSSCRVSYPLSFDPETMVCAGELFGGRDSCSGDSGGPLLVPETGDRMLIAGVVSFGTGCGVPTQYGVYARVGDTTLNGWINSKLPPLAAPAPTPPLPAPPGSSSTSGTATPVTLSFSRALGSARRAARTRRVRLRVGSSGPVFSLRASLSRVSRGKRVILARGTAARLTGRTTLRLKVMSRLRSGTVQLKLTARDAQGRPVKKSGSARLSR
jgi:secreted trypsin-like serine protease